MHDLRLLSAIILGAGALLGLAACSGIAVSKPFAWPGFDPSQARLIGPARDRGVVAITHAELDGAFRAAFDAGARQVLDRLDRQPGLVGYSVRSRLIGHEVWTVTVWTDEAALEAFVRSAAHVQAMRAGAPAVKTIQYHRFDIPVSELPLDWRRVMAELSKARPARPAMTS